MAECFVVSSPAQSPVDEHQQRREVDDVVLNGVAGVSSLLPLRPLLPPRY